MRQNSKLLDDDGPAKWVDACILAPSVPTTCSWWIEPVSSRAEFDAKVQAEKNRMNGGRFGRVVRPSGLKD